MINVYEDVGRWPPVYDFEELANVIKKLINSEELFKQFFKLYIKDTELLQGDIVNFKGYPCYIDASGDISALEQEYNHWMILGNSCDLARTSLQADSSLGLPHLTHITPLIPIDRNIPRQVLTDLKKFKLFKKMFVPSWSSNQNYYIDFTIITSIEKKCLLNNALVEARLRRNSWFLFHACLVRYLARDDGRND